MKKFFFLSLFFVLTHCYTAISQSNFKYELSLIPVSINGLPGIQSFAYAQYEGKWVIIGGRKDGLHARQPFNAFPAAQSNTDIYVIDIAKKQFISRSVNELPTNLKEQLQSTNLNYHQIEDTLYLIGGYGYSESSNNHITYPYLTTINIKTLIEAIEQDQPIQSHFKQMRNDVFSVTGGHLEHMYDKFYLVGGHRFDGRYNPMGNPTFTQAYTNQIQMFTIDNSGDQLQYSNYSVITDPVHLRRRDYNLLPQIFPNGKEGLTISSGVFQLNADLPFLYPVDITENGYEPITNFNQYLSNYHSAVANLHDSIGNNMHSLFFGGISQYYYQNGALIKDDLVPFVKTISRLTRTGDGKLTEYQLPISMPSLQGAGSEFIVNKSMPHYSNEVLKLHEIKDNAFKIGHIFGGIQSNSLNPFSVNQTSSTKADNTIYEVWLTAAAVSVEDQQIDGHNPHEMDIFPNPFQKEFTASFQLKEATKVSYIITNALGKIIQKTSSKQLPAGNHTITIAIDDEHSGGPMLMTMIFDDIYYVSKKLIQQ